MDLTIIDSRDVFFNADRSLAGIFFEHFERCLVGWHGVGKLIQTSIFIGCYPGFLFEKACKMLLVFETQLVGNLPK